MNWKKERQERSKRFDFVWLIFLILFIGAIVIQAVTKLGAGDLAGGKNYYGQPIGPLFQLIAVGVGIVAFLIYIITGKTRKKGKDAPTPSWMKDPPYRWPWNR